MAGGSGIRQGGWYSSRLGAWLSGGAILAGISLVLLVNLRTEPPGRSSERRCVEVVGAMVQSGDWLVPRLSRQVRLQKPPLFYWAGATTAKLLGDTGSIAVRLPSALAALALVALLMRWGRSLGGRGMGLAAGAALVANFQLPASGRRGDAEVLLVLLCVATLVVFDRLHVTQRRAWLPLFGVLAGLAILTKATAVILIVALPIVAFLWLQGELRRLRDPGVLGACGLALAIGASWYVAIFALVPGAFETLWNDLLTPLGVSSAGGGDALHLRPVWWYLTVLPQFAAPASLLAPVVAWRLWTTRLYQATPRLRFAALCLLVPFVAFSLLPQKQKHYALAMLPGLALLSAEAVAALAPIALARLGRILGAPLALAGLAGTGVIALFFVWIEGLPAPGVAAGASLLGALFAVALVASLRGRAIGFALAFVPAFLLTYTAYRSVVVVRVAQMEAGGFGGLSLDERERLYRVAREQPWFFDLLQITREANGRD